jgi:ribosomal protein S18 acetylase RimI-like enzyme
MSEISVRQARIEDLDGLLSVYRDAQFVAPGADRSDSASSRPVLAAMLAQPGRHLLVGERDGEVLGTVDVVIVANLTHEAKPWAVIENVAVAERAQRIGVGRRLMERAFELAREAGCYKAMLMSGKQRAGAHAFYRELGMSDNSEGFKIYLDGYEPPPGTA